jgi:multidrug efflux system outer membrane protein
MRLSWLSALLLAACASNPVVDPQPSGIATPSFWSRLAGARPDAPLTTDATAQVEQDWWKHFDDPTLDMLIAEALKNNKTLAIAKARVEEARADRLAARSALFPQIDATASASRGNQGLLTNEQTLTITQVGVEADWELDLFGKNQARVSEATAILQSAEASRQAVTVALLAEVARTYFDMRNYERQLDLTQQNLDYQKKTLEITEAQFKGALASDFDVQRAGAQVSTTESQLPTLQIAYDAALNRLNVLLGYPPGEKDALLKTGEPLKSLDAKVIVTAPATVLVARPDVRAAARRFAASISAHEAARAELFPDISLLALFGVQADPISTNIWNIGGSLVQPILNFGRIRAQIDAANTRQQQAYLTYQQTVLEALENMENALSSYLNETTRNASLNQAVTQDRKAQELATQQYKGGEIGLLDVLVTERNVLDAESSLAASDIQLRKALVNIYTAAGGGWDVAENK